MPKFMKNLNQLVDSRVITSYLQVFSVVLSFASPLTVFSRTLVHSTTTLKTSALLFVGMSTRF
jgi:hypothetical protein